MVKQQKLICIYSNMSCYGFHMIFYSILYTQVRISSKKTLFVGGYQFSTLRHKTNKGTEQPEVRTNLSGLISSRVWLKTNSGVPFKKKKSSFSPLVSQ